MKTLVCTLLSKNTLFLLCLLSISTSYGQVLTITSSGGETGTSGTNWSITGNTLTVTGTANIRASVIENHLNNTGPLTIVGNTTNFTVQVFEAINVTSGSNSLVIGASGNQGGIVNTQLITLPGSISFNGGFVWFENNVVTTGSGAKILAKANEYPPGVNATDGFIVLNSNISLTTSGGDIILWSNATNRTAAYGQANNEITLSGSNTLSTSGGKIVLAGGSDDGSNGGTASDGIPDGYAYRGSNTGEAVNIGSIVTLNSGGGEIIIRGEQNGSDAAVGADATFTISNGGAVTIEGKNTTATSVAIGTANIASTATNAPVTISGTTHITNSGLTTITTSGGDVTLWADSDNSGAGYVDLNNASIVTNGGDITIGGGSDPTADAAIGPKGVNIHSGSSLDAGSGAISIRGNSSSTSNFGIGVRVHTATITSGNATFFGEGTTQAAGDNWGVSFEHSTLTASGNVNITGTGGGTTGNFNHGLYYGSSTLNISGSTNMVGNGGLSSGIANFGVQLNASSINGLGSGAMNITGTGGSNASSSDNDGISINNTSTVQSGSGTMTLTGTPGSGASSEGIFFVNGTTLGHATNQTGDITVRTDLLGSTGVDVLGTGALTIEPLPAESSFGAAYTFSNITLGANLSGLTLGKANNTADVTIPNAVNIAGPINIYGGDIAVNENLNTTAGGALGVILLKASGNITQAASKSITTSDGDVTLWADSDGSGVGYIQLTGGSNSGIASGGGNIFLGGGLDLATGYARGAAVTDVTPPPHNFTVHIAGVYLRDGTEINSGGGNITLRGQNVGNSDNYLQPGIMGIGTTLDAGTGKIALYGLAGGSGNANAQAISTTTGWTIRSASTEADAITLIGDATTTDNAVTSLGLNFAGIIEATGNGGGIVLTGTSGTTTGFGDGLGLSGDVLAASGTITITGTDDATNPNNRDLFLDNATLGSKTATNVPSSTANVVVRGNRPAFGSNVAVNTSGTFTLESDGDDFTSAVTVSNLTLGAAVSGLTIGKASSADGTSDVNVTIDNAVNIAGPITVYGGDIAGNANLTSTAAGAAVLLKGSGAINQAANIDVTTNGGDVTFWADSDGNGSGYIQTGSSASIATSGGNIVLGGGANIVTGYARGADIRDTDTETNLEYDLRISGVHLKDGTSLSSGGGNITLRGQNLGTAATTLQFGIMGHNAVLNAGAGKISLNGLATGSGTSNGQGISYYGSWTMTSSNPDADAISLIGDASGYNGTNASIGINMDATIQATGGGGINVQGIGGTSSGFDSAIEFSGDLLANSGNITLIGENNVATQTGVNFNSRGNTRIGFAGGSSVTASSSHIDIKADRVDFGASTALNTTGAVNILSLDASDSFGAGQTISSNMVLDAGVGGLTIGKASNTADVTINNAIDIAGPITAYGGNVTVNKSLTSVGDILLSASNNFITDDDVPGTREINSNNNNISIIADSDANAPGDNTDGKLDLDLLELIAGSGDILISGEYFEFAVSTGLTPEISSSTGSLTIEPSDASFSTVHTHWFVLPTTLSSFTLGKSGNTGGIIFDNALSVAGPITVYGGTITLGADLTTTNSGDISLYTDNALGGLSATRNLTAVGSFKYIPSGSSFAQDVTYPITNLTVSSNGLTIGKTGNTGNITLNTDLNINAIALFGGTLALNHNIDCSSLEIEGTATLAKDKYISATGNMTNNATLILSSDSREFSRLKVDGTVSGSGTFKYQRYVAGSDTKDLISSPFPGENFGSLVTNNPVVLGTNPSNSNQYLFGRFDNDNGVYQTYFSTTNASTPLTAGEGYRAGTENGATLVFTGTYPTGDQTISINLGSHNTYGKWNLVGNPFPTYLDLEGFISDNSAILEDINTAVYAYDGDDTDGSNWDIYNLSNSNEVKIAPGQAFFVASSSSGGNLTFNTSRQTISSGGKLTLITSRQTISSGGDLTFNTSRQTITGGDDFLAGLWQTPDAHAVINLKNTDQVSSTDLYINTNGSLGLDPGYDAGTYANESSDFSLYTKLADGSYPDTKFAIQTIADDLSQTVVIPLGVHINAGKGYSIGLDDNSLLELVHIYLKDNATGAFTLLNDEAYFFETDVDLEGALRFELHLSDQATLGTPDESLTSFKTVYHNDEVLLVGVFQSEDTIEIYDVMGLLIQEYRPEQNGFGKLVISDQNKASGAYIARINRKGTYQSQKFLIN